MFFYTVEYNICHPYFYTVLLRAIHKLGKESENFFSSLNKLYANTGKQLINDEHLPVNAPSETISKSILIFYFNFI